MQTMETHAPSYHNMSGLSYTELWNALHSVHHTFQSSNYNLSGSYQGDQPREFPQSSVVNSVDAEFSGGSQWSGDSDVNGSITIGKRDTTLVPYANNYHEMGSLATAAKTTTKTLTGLQTFQPLTSSQNRLVMQTPQQGIDRDWYSLEPRWMDPKLLQSGEHFKVADSDAADALLSMKRAAVVHLNPALVNPNPLMQLRTRDRQTMKGLMYDELTPFIEEKSGVDQSTRKVSSVVRSAIGSDPGREMHEVKDVAHTKFWRHQDISRMYNSSSDGYAISAKTTKESSSDEDFRSSGYHSSDSYQTTGLSNTTQVSPYNKAGGHGTSESDRYFTRSSEGPHFSDFTSGRGSVNVQASLGSQSHIATTPIQRSLQDGKATIGRTMDGALVNNQQKQHQKTHSATNQNHQCRICGKACTRPSSLRTHIRCHYGDKPYLCQLCGKNFSQAANLTAHMRIHSGEKPFKCTVCSRSFSQSSSVKTHMRTHTGERPYSCNFCSKAFSDSSTLSNHRRTHTGEKPYQCLVCYRPFSQSGNLNRHMRIHHRRTNGQQANKAAAPAAVATMA